MATATSSDSRSADRRRPSSSSSHGRDRDVAARRSSRLLVVLILLLMAIPLLAGGYRLVTLAIGADITPENVRFFISPFPVVRFVPSIRRRNPAWHRRAGRVAVVSGLVAALSTLWMSVPYALPASDGALLLAFQLIFGLGMVGSICRVLLRVLRLKRGAIVSPPRFAQGPAP